MVIQEGICQAKLEPPIHHISDPSLAEFLRDLEDAIYVKDKEFIIGNLNPQIQNSFGGDGGIDEFKQYWNWDSESSKFWNLMTKLLELGGGEFNGGDTYRIPYVNSMWPSHDEFDVFEHMAITGSNVNVRENPSIESPTTAQLNYDIVTVNYNKSHPPFNSPKINGVKYIGSKEWYYIESVDKSIQGYVNWNYIWSPVGYRLGLYKKNDKWLISSLIAGD